MHPLPAALDVRSCLVMCTLLGVGLAPAALADEGSLQFTPPAPEAAPAPAPAPARASTMSPTATFGLSDSRFHEDKTIFWEGFLTGLRGFEHFYEPVGQPLYFESPFINSNVRALYLHHDFPNGSQIAGGDLHIAAAQARLAITERLAFIATKDGHSWLNAGALPNDNGWNDLAFGFKYAVWVDREHDWVLTPGVRVQIPTGNTGVLQGEVGEASPFVSFAKGFDRLHLLGNLTWRVPFDANDGNQVFSWDAHVDFEVSPESLPGFAPLVELHGLHYLTNGNRTPLTVGGLDYTNLGSAFVAGSEVIWMGVGARWKLTPHIAVGSTFEFPLTDKDDDIMGNRVTVDLILSW